MLTEITPACLRLDENGLPHAPEFSDHYYSDDDGLAESRHVFLGGNQLPQRWQGQEQFVIAETGFGTGLNFLATLQAWSDDPQRSQTLHYFSIEKYPIPGQQLARLLKRWPELQAWQTELLEHYPPVLAGFHHLLFAEGQVRLTLCFADINEALQELLAKVDAWYLDGFAPGKNPEMWTAGVFQQIVAHSQPGATLATFTAAGQVRRDLQVSGFEVSKRPGFGRKRDMLSARLPVSSAPDNPRSHQAWAHHQPWFDLPSTQAGLERSACVIGGGIAGCQIARALAMRGWQVLLVERHAELAQEASGNRAGVLTPKMTAQPDWGERFYRSSFLYALRQLRMLEQQGAAPDWQPCGALQLNHNEREYKRWLSLGERGLPADFLQLPDAEQASALAGIPLETGGSFFPAGGWLNPASLCKVLVRHPHIQVKCQTRALSLHRDQHGWQVRDAQQNKVSAAAVLVIANGRDIQQFEQTAFLPFIPVRGQTTLASASPGSSRLRITLGHEGYLTSAWQGEHVFGASFERNQSQPILKTTDDQDNYRQLQHYLPGLAADLQNIRSGHCAIRMTTPDRYPCVGAVPDQPYYLEHYNGLQHGRQHQQFPPAHYLPGLYVSAGYGSRGLTTSALCSEMLAALINREPIPVEYSLYGKLHPARFLLRQLQRKQVSANTEQ